MRNDETGFRVVVAPVIDPAASPPRTPVHLQLDWLRNVQFAGPLVADARGLYAAHGLDVRIVPIDLETLDPIGPVLEADGLAIGVADGNALLRARREGEPVVAFATMFSRSPLGIVTLEKNGIDTLADLAGKRIALHAYNFPQLEIMLADSGLDLNDVTPVVIGDDIGALTRGEVDAQVAYMIDEAVALEQKGHEVKRFYGSDHGYFAYSQVYFTSERNWRRFRAEIAAFLHASNRGWDLALAGIESSAAMIAQQSAGGLDSNTQARALELVRPLVRARPGATTGQMTRSQWLQTPGATEDLVDALVDLSLFGTPVR